MSDPSTTRRAGVLKRLPCKVDKWKSRYLLYFLSQHASLYDLNPCYFNDLSVVSIFVKLKRKKRLIGLATKRMCEVQTPFRNHCTRGTEKFSTWPKRRPTTHIPLKKRKKNWSLIMFSFKKIGPRTFQHSVTLLEDSQISLAFLTRRDTLLYKIKIHFSYHAVWSAKHVKVFQIYGLSNSRMYHLGNNVSSCVVFSVVTMIPCTNPFSKSVFLLSLSLSHVCVCFFLIVLGRCKFTKLNFTVELLKKLKTSCC